MRCGRPGAGLPRALPSPARALCPEALRSRHCVGMPTDPSIRPSTCIYDQALQVTTCNVKLNVSLSSAYLMPLPVFFEQYVSYYWSYLMDTPTVMKPGELSFFRPGLGYLITGV